MANIPKITFSQDPSGSPITFTDASTLDSSIGNYTRQVKVYSGINGSGELLATLDLTETNLTVKYYITEDIYRSSVLVHTGSPAVADAMINFTTQQFSQNVLNARLKSGCGCGKTKNCDATTLGFIYMHQSQVATLAGNSGLANSFIASSLKWLNS